MPKLKRKTSHVSDQTGFEIYDGPEPRPGMYPAVIKQCRISESSAGNLMYNIVVELATSDVKGKEEYNGWPGFPPAQRRPASAAQALSVSRIAPTSVSTPWRSSHSAM